MSMPFTQIMQELESLANPEAVKGMARFGIQGARVLGISIPELRRMARQVGNHHTLALELWGSGVHEARLLATMIADVRQLTETQMENWVNDFDSWDLCDQCCGNLFVRSPLAFSKALEWADRREEFVRRAGFALMAYLAVHAKKAPDDDFAPFFPKIEQYAADNRNFVKKAVNWALRQIGKRNPHLNQQAVKLSLRLVSTENKTALWVGKDAYRELTSVAVQNRLAKRQNQETLT
jgi:3-methyladenine DNA glycosylase AlkD